jgi:hypothetical protein
MKYTKALSSLAAVAAILALVAPSAASAHGLAFGKDKREDRKENREERRAIYNEFGVQVFENGNVEFPGFFYKGTVSAVSGTGFTLKTKNDATFTINTTSAKIVQLPHTTISLSGIAVGDSASATGAVSGSTIDASVVFITKANQKPATAKGTVTAVSGNTVTVQTKNDQTITVNTDSSTQVVKQDGTSGTVAADVTTGSKVRLWGLWDSVAHLFSAIKIRLK